MKNENECGNNGHQISVHHPRLRRKKVQNKDEKKNEGFIKDANSLLIIHSLGIQKEKGKTEINSMKKITNSSESLSLHHPLLSEREESKLWIIEGTAKLVVPIQNERVKEKSAVKCKNN